MSIDSGSSAGVLFRTEESSTISREGPSYYLDLRPDQTDDVRFSMLDNGFITIDEWEVGLSYNTPYTVTIYAINNLYYFYLDDIEVAVAYNHTAFSTGSIGLRTRSSPSTFYSMTYSEDVVVSIFPNTSIGPVNVSTSESTVTTTDSWTGSNALDQNWYDM